MGWFEKSKKKGKEQLKIVVSNPENFEEKWSFSSTRIQLYSLAIILFIVFGVLFHLLITSGIFSSYSTEYEYSNQRKKLVKQHDQIKKLYIKIENQENYIKNITKIISGNIPLDSVSNSVPDAQRIIQPKLNYKATSSEKEIAKNVKKDKRAHDSKKDIFKKNLKFSDR